MIEQAESGSARKTSAPMTRMAALVDARADEMTEIAGSHGAFAFERKTLGL